MGIVDSLDSNLFPAVPTNSSHGPLARRDRRGDNSSIDPNGRFSSRYFLQAGKLAALASAAPAVVSSIEPRSENMRSHSGGKPPSCPLDAAEIELLAAVAERIFPA